MIVNSTVRSTVDVFVVNDAGTTDLVVEEGVLIQELFVLRCREQSVTHTLYLSIM